jgi:hypothetical protein
MSQNYGLQKEYRRDDWTSMRGEDRSVIESGL